MNLSNEYTNSNDTGYMSDERNWRSDGSVSFIGLASNPVNDNDIEVNNDGDTDASDNFYGGSLGTNRNNDGSSVFGNSSLSATTSLTSKPKKSRKRYNLQFKQKVVEFKKNVKSVNKCASAFNLDRRMVSRWIKNSENIKKTKRKRLRTNVGSSKNKSMYPIMETRLYEWICEKRRIGGCVSGFAIKQKALELYKESYNLLSDSLVEFKASNGWFENFCKRHDLVLRRITTKGRELPKNTNTIIKKFFMDCQSIVNNPSCTQDQILNMDETTIYLDFRTNYTFAVKGSKRVPATTTGSERTRLSAAFTASASGEKLPIFILYTHQNNQSIQHNNQYTHHNSQCTHQNNQSIHHNNPYIHHNKPSVHRNSHYIYHTSHIHLNNSVLPMHLL